MNQPSQPMPIQWGEMRPLDLKKGQLDSFPVFEFPPVIADYIMAVAEVTQTMPDMSIEWWL